MSFFDEMSRTVLLDRRCVPQRKALGDPYRTVQHMPRMHPADIEAIARRVAELLKAAP